MTDSAATRSSIGKAWADTLAHLPTLLLIWLVGIAFYVVSVVISFAISYLFGVIDDGSGFGVSIGSILGAVSQFPFFIVQSFAGVMLTAVPAVFYQKGSVVTFSAAYSLLMERLGRYFLAGILFSFASTLGIFLCILPGVAILLTMPVYVNKVFTTDEGVFSCLTSSFSVLFGSEKGWLLVGIQVAAMLLAVVTCGFCLVGLLIYVPFVTFFVQAYIVDNGLVRASRNA